MEELIRIEELSLNNNLTEWEKKHTKDLKIYSLNCRSLKKHFEDIKTDSIVLQSSIICLQETWLEEDDNCTEYELPTYSTHPNNYGRGKGIVIFYKQKIFTHILDVKEKYMQLSKFSSSTIDVIAIYRSQEGCYHALNRHLDNLLTGNKPTLVVGDFNFCYLEQSTQTKKFLDEKQFTQLVHEPTHIDGHILDQAYLLNDSNHLYCCTETHSKYYTDHKGLAITINKD